MKVFLTAFNFLLFFFRERTALCPEKGVIPRSSSVLNRPSAAPVDALFGGAVLKKVGTLFNAPYYDGAKTMRGAVTFARVGQGGLNAAILYLRSRWAKVLGFTYQ